MIYIKYAVCLIIPYLLGSLSTSIVLSRVFWRRDIRELGSHNAGATNMARSFGLIAGLATMLGDVLKAVISVCLGYWLLGDTGLALGGLACALGHCFPIYHSFAGGKGVSTGVVVAFAVDWRCGIVALLSFLLCALASHKISLSSILGTYSALITASLLFLPLARFWLVFFVALLIIFRHRANLLRLINGTEPDFVLPGHSR